MSIQQEHDLEFKDQGVMVLGCGPYHIGEMHYHGVFNILMTGFALAIFIFCHFLFNLFYGS